MRILHVTDFHFRRPWFAWLAARAGDYDAICFTGDLRDLFPNAPTGLSEQIRWTRDWLQKFPGRLHLCSGNHDWWLPDGRMAEGDPQGGWLRQTVRPGILVDGTSELFAGYRFICCPAVGIPAAPGPEPAVVLVHTPPLGTPVSLDLGREAGNPEVTAAVFKLPEGSLVLSGHVHDPQRWCHRLGPAWCFNPGVDFSAAEPNHLVIDTAMRAAEFSSRGFIETVFLQ